MQDSIFTKIIKGQIPCYKIYEDDKIIAFLDIYPIRPGHVLVVPKKQIDQFDELDNDDYLAMFDVTKKVAKKLKDKLGVERACLRIEGFDVPHAHVHVIPCNTAGDFYNMNRMQKAPDHKALANMAQKLKFNQDTGNE